MQDESRAVGEGPSTLGAHKRLLPSVDPLMHCKVASKLGLPVRALIRLLPTVDFLMPGKAAPGLKGFPTVTELRGFPSIVYPFMQRKD